MASVLALVISWVEQYRIEQRRSEVREELRYQAVAIQNDLQRALSATYSLAALVRQGKGTIQDFEGVAQELLPYYPGVSAFQLVPQGVIQQTYPREGNEPATGLNLLQNPKKYPEALLARETRRLTLQGPFLLKQGGLGLVGRLPVFLDNPQGADPFWGFTAVLLRFPEVLQSTSLQQIEKSGFHYELWQQGSSSRQLSLIARNTATPLRAPVEARIQLPNSTWILMASPQQGWWDGEEMGLYVVMGLLVSGLVTLLVASQYRTVVALANTKQALAERERSQADRVASEQKFRLAFDNANTGMCLVDLQGKLLQVNAKMGAIFGYSQAMLEGMTVNDLTILDDKGISPHFIQEAVAGRVDSATFEKRYRHQQGQIIYAEVSSSLVRDAQGQPLYFISQIQDVTQRKQAYAQLAQLNAELEERVTQRTQDLQQREAILQRLNEELLQANRLKDEFLAMISHELRTPLNAILGMTEALQEEIFGPLTAKQNQALQTVEQSGNHLLNVISDILDLSKIEAGQMELALEPTSIYTICEQSLALVRPQAQKKRIHLQTQLPPHLPLLTLDQRRCCQALTNILNNAVKFTPAQGTIQLTVSYRPAEASHTVGHLHFAVQDTGIGIAPDNLDRVFQPFIQVDGALNRRYEGTGLGLALVKQIVELHGGHVGVTSEMGVGSCFWFDIPCSVEVETSLVSAPPQAMQNLAQEPLPEPPLVLLAEDSPANAVSIQNYLEAKGYRVRVAENGQVAVAIAQADPPDIILMDIQMPVMNGIEAMEILRQDPQFQNLPIIALTALAMEGDRERCLAAGATDYLSKPVKLRELLQRIQQLC
ncbi:hypothetical protein OLK001_28660 [Synechocystis sp. LKSZ1]